MHKTHYLIISFSFFFILLFLCGCESLDCGIRAIKLDEIPEEFITLSEEQMDNYPHLKEAISSGETVITPYNEYMEINNLLKEIRNIQYLDEFYKIIFVTP